MFCLYNLFSYSFIIFSFLFSINLHASGLFNPDQEEQSRENANTLYPCVVSILSRPDTEEGVRATGVITDINGQLVLLTNRHVAKPNWKLWINTTLFQGLEVLNQPLATHLRQNSFRYPDIEVGFNNRADIALVSFVNPVLLREQLDMLGIKPARLSDFVGGKNDTIGSHLVGCSKQERFFSTAEFHKTRPLVKSAMNKSRSRLGKIDELATEVAEVASQSGDLRLTDEFIDVLEMQVAETQQIAKLASYSVFESTNEVFGEIPGFAIKGDSGGGAFEDGKLWGLIFAINHSNGKRVTLVQSLFPLLTWLYEQVNEETIR